MAHGLRSTTDLSHIQRNPYMQADSFRRFIQILLILVTTAPVTNAEQTEVRRNGYVFKAGEQTTQLVEQLVGVRSVKRKSVQHPGAPANVPEIVPAGTWSQYQKGNSPCTGAKVQQLKATLSRQPRIALIIAERISRIPMRVTERMERFARALQGADSFVAVEPDDAKYVPYLRPVPTKVGYFNRSVESREGVTYFNKMGSIAIMQLLRVTDAFNLIRKHETEQGWKYDVVARLRLESVHADSCTIGPDEGCYRPGAWAYSMAAYSLLAKTPTIYKQHDRAFLGRRDDMERLFCHSIPEYVEAKTNTTALYGGLVCTPGSVEICTQAIQIRPKGARKKEIDPKDFPGEYTVAEIAQKLGFEISDQPSQGSLFVQGDSGGALMGMDIRRFSYDYPYENPLDKQPIESGCPSYPATTHVFQTPHSYPCGYASGCAPYPPIQDRLPESEIAAHKQKAGGSFLQLAPLSIEDVELYDSMEGTYPPQ
jgi:hypothetical protein